MTNPFGPGSDFLVQMRAVTDALVPVLDAFRAELGAERANAIAQRGIARWRRELAEAAAARLVGSPRDCFEKATADMLATIDGVVELSELTEEPNAIRFAVTACRVAEMFRARGESELGFELACAHDTARVEALGKGEVLLDRRGTLMTGARACDFAYRFADEGDAK